MKKAASILFLSIFLYNIAGYYVAFKILQYENRERISAECDAHNASCDLAVLRIADSDAGALRWHGDDEFEYQGRLYDVSRSVHEGSATLYYCINDTKEESLVASVNEHVKNSTGDADNQNRESKIALKNVTQEYYYHNAQFLSVQKTDERFLCEINIPCLYVQPDIPTPPPKA